MSRMQKISPRPLKCICLVVLCIGLSSTLSCSAQDTDVSGDGEVQVENLGTRKTGEDWPTFLGPEQNSRSSETGVVTPWTEESLKRVWERPLGTSYGIGSVSKGRYLQFDRIRNEAVVNCLHAESGEELWTFSYDTDYTDLYGYDGGPRCSPVIDGHRVFVYGVEGLLHCLDLRDGKLLWKVDTSKDFKVIQNFFGVGSTPVVAGDLLLVMVGGSPQEAQLIPAGQLNRVTGLDSGIVAFDKRTGEVRYKITDELASYASLTIAEIDGTSWCFAFLRGGLLAFQPAAPKNQHFYPWRARILESVNASTPIIVGNEILISETYGPGAALLRLTSEGLEEVWTDEDRGRDKALQTHWNTPVYHDGYVYASSGRHSQDAELRCVEWKTGKVMWSVPRLGRCSLLYVDDHLVCLGEYGELRLLKPNPEKFEQLSVLELKSKDAVAAKFDLDTNALKYPCWAAPIVSHGLMYVRGNRRLLCLEIIPSESAK